MLSKCPWIVHEHFHFLNAQVISIRGVHISFKEVRVRSSTVQTAFLEPVHVDTGLTREMIRLKSGSNRFKALKLILSYRVRNRQTNLDLTGRVSLEPGWSETGLAIGSGCRFASPNNAFWRLILKGYLITSSNPRTNFPDFISQTHSYTQNHITLYIALHPFHIIILQLHSNMVTFGFSEASSKHTNNKWM